MGANSAIEWTDHTFNPWWGCQRVSPGCEHCYAESFAKRVGFGGKPPDQGPIKPPKPLLWGARSERRFFGDAHWAQLTKWNEEARRVGVRRRVFCASMADVFEDREELVEPRQRLGAAIVKANWLIFQLLTKRPENMIPIGKVMWPEGWPPNVWAGCTAEDQKRADERIPILLQVPAAVRFVSYEPALEAVNFYPWLDDDLDDRLAWIIVGGESGSGARPFNLKWARRVVEQCRKAGVACFVKQFGANVFDEGIGLLDDEAPDAIDVVRVRLKDGHGGDMTEWRDESLKVREFPRTA